MDTFMYLMFSLMVSMNLFIRDSGFRMFRMSLLFDPCYPKMKTKSLACKNSCSLRSPLVCPMAP